MPITSKRYSGITKNKNANLRKTCCRLSEEVDATITETTVTITEETNDALKDNNISVSTEEDTCKSNLKARKRNSSGELSGINIPNTNCVTNCDTIFTEKDILDFQDKKYCDFKNNSQTLLSMTKDESCKCEKDETRTHNLLSVPTGNELKELVGLNRDCSEVTVCSDRNELKPLIGNMIAEQRKLYGDDCRQLKFTLEYFNPMYPD